MESIVGRELCSVEMSRESERRSACYPRLYHICAQLFVLIQFGWFLHEKLHIFYPIKPALIWLDFGLGVLGVRLDFV